jgi:hypothetical protein
MDTPKNQMLVSSRRLDLNFKYKVFQKRFNLIFNNLPFANFTIKTFKEFFQKIEKKQFEQNSSLMKFLLTIWDQEYVNLIYNLIPKYKYYFLLSYKIWFQKRKMTEKEEELGKQCEIYLIKIIMLLSLEKNEFFLTVLQSQVLNDFYQFLTIKFIKHSKQSIIEYINKVSSMVQEFVGLSIQFFLCIDSLDTLHTPEGKIENYQSILEEIFKKYNLNRKAYEFHFCDYFSSDYLILFDKTFNGEYGESELLKNREKIFDKISEVVKEISQKKEISKIINKFRVGFRKTETRSLF